MKLPEGQFYLLVPLHLNAGIHHDLLRVGLNQKKLFPPLISQKPSLFAQGEDVLW